MWPKMLLELLPHFVRLMPVADKWFNTRSASDKAQEAALAALAVDLRGQIGQVTETQDGIGRQLQAQNQQVAELAVDVTRARIAAESAEVRIASLEKTAATAMKLMWTALALLAVVTLVLMVVLAKLRAH
ncbi:MAG TPA: hypothetical protein VF865_21575 [Acidobacteriaceae bacterium]